ncbi:MAG: glucose sorbosone dehydrogenase [Actinomycetota bacterium]
MSAPWSRHLVGVLVLFGATLLATGCGSAPMPLPQGIEVAEDFELEFVFGGLERPSQIAMTSDGDFIAAEVVEENGGIGRIVRIDREEPDGRVVLQSGLDKPTGIAVVGEQLWIMERDRLSVTSLEPDAELDVVAADLPNNGRSEGTLTVTPDGALLYNTSGRKRGAVRTEGSGAIFRVEDPSAGTASPMTTVATGFKHAYAHAFTPDGSLWSVEMTDGTFDGNRASDKLVRIEPGSDGGWPFCIDDNVPVIEFGGTTELCAESPRSHALFGPGATPTGLVVAPWDASVFLVTLWIPGTVVSVPVEAGANAHPGTIVISGIESPQSLLVDGDRVLVVDHETGDVYALTAAP